MTKPKTTITRLRTVAFALVLMCLGAGFAAADTVYVNEASFITASGPLGFESFEGLTATNTETSPFSATLSAFTVSAPGLAGVYNVNFAGDHATDGNNYISIDTFTSTVKFTFSSPVNEFGVTITDYGDFTALPLGFTTNGGSTGTAALGSKPDANVQFFGIIATNPFTSITFTGTDPFGVDGVRFGSTAAPTVPEPASILLLGTGLIAAFAAKRWQRQTQ